MLFLSEGVQAKPQRQQRMLRFQTMFVIKDAFLVVSRHVFILCQLTRRHWMNVSQGLDVFSLKIPVLRRRNSSQCGKTSYSNSGSTAKCAAGNAPKCYKKRNIDESNARSSTFLTIPTSDNFVDTFSMEINLSLT